MKKMFLIILLPVIVLVSWCWWKLEWDLNIDSEKKDNFSRNIECNRLAKDIEERQCEWSQEKWHKCEIDDINYNEKYNTCFWRITFISSDRDIWSTSYYNLVTRSEMGEIACSNYWGEIEFENCLTKKSAQEREWFKEYWNYYNY